MARVSAAVASNGVLRDTRCEQDEAASAATDRFLNGDDARVLGGYMRDVVLSGTGRVLRNHPGRIAGKTGTAQLDGRAVSRVVRRLRAVWSRQPDESRSPSSSRTPAMAAAAPRRPPEKSPTRHRAPGCCSEPTWAFFRTRETARIEDRGQARPGREGLLAIPRPQPAGNRALRSWMRSSSRSSQPAAACACFRSIDSNCRWSRRRRRHAAVLKRCSQARRRFGRGSSIGCSLPDARRRTCSSRSGTSITPEANWRAREFESAVLTRRRARGRRPGARAAARTD